MNNNKTRENLYKKMIVYNTFLVIIQSDYGKAFAMFIPCKFEEAKQKSTQE